MNYAMIKNGVIDNIIVADYTMAQTLKQLQEYDEAINCDNYPVGVGDIYENGYFMNAEDVKDENGNILIPARTVIERNMTQEEYIKILETENTKLKNDALNIAEILLDLGIRIEMIETGV